jgi:hypothetical protein
MNAADIARALGDARREDPAWRCRCPLHGGRSLVLRDGDGGRVLATWWAVAIASTCSQSVTPSAPAANTNPDQPHQHKRVGPQ